LTWAALVALRKSWLASFTEQKRKQSFPSAGSGQAALQKRTGSLGLPVWRNFVTEVLRLEAFLHLRELQFGFGQGLYDEAFGVFRSEVASGGHFTDQEILGAL
jgi:hypothetical protein